MLLRIKYHILHFLKFDKQSGYYWKGFLLKIYFVINVISLTVKQFLSMNESLQYIVSLIAMKQSLE